MFKIVYILTSNVKDYYYNQLMISLVSLRNQMPNQPVEVIMDQDTYETLTGNRGDIFQYAEIVKVNVDEKYSQKERSRYLKTSLRRYIEGDFLFIDCDTVICSDFSFFSDESFIAMTLDRNCLMSERDDKGKSIYEVGKRCGFNLDNCEKYFNSGVMWVRDTIETEEFFEDWHTYWKETLKIGMCVDQPSLNYVNYLKKNVINELDGKWNCQVTLRPAGVSYINDAYIMHYFNIKANGPYLLCNEAVIRAGLDDPTIKKVIANPRAAFKPSYLVTMNSDTNELLESRAFKILLKIYKNAHEVYEFGEKMLAAISKLKGTLIRDKNWKNY